LSDSEADKAKRFALKLIRYRDRSEAELTKRLQIKGFPDQIIHRTIEFLKETGLVNDTALARTLTDIAINVRLLGNKGVGFFLRSRGISDDDFPSEAPGAPDEIERALTLYRKKSKSLSSLPDTEKKKKMRGYLLRKGYSAESVNKVLRTLFKS